MCLWVGAIFVVNLLSGCSNSERNVIIGKPPFYQTNVSLDKARIDAVIEAVQSFSRQHKMDFLLARKSLGPGEFNASANGSSINLRAMHSGLLDKGVNISAIARGNPTPQDRALLEEFVARVRESAGNEN
jgi:hypothetical protein